MARMVGYRCQTCGVMEEELFVSSEEPRPEILDRPCPKCGGRLVRWDIKNNEHRVYVYDN